jgi:3-hydroxyisobutyrate dehydrogenase-like beta-hydroxyacid dehydrogenase
MTPIGFVGVGNMGLPMADKLIDAGESLVVYDTREAALEPLLIRQARRAESPRAIADSCATVFTSLPTLESIKQVMLGEQGLIAGRTLKTVVNTSTIGVPLTEEIAKALANKGIGLVDCPVSGGPGGARTGTLSVMVSGAPEAIHSVRHLISHWGVITIAGEKPGMAQLLKLTNNILSAVAIAATAEAFVMGAKGGLDPEVMTTAINAGSGRNSMTLQKIPTCVLDRSFNYGGPIHLLMKDIDLAIAHGEALGIPMWVCQAARLVFKHATFAGMSDRDVTEIVKLVERSASFELPKTR